MRKTIARMATIALATAMLTAVPNVPPQMEMFGSRTTYAAVATEPPKVTIDGSYVTFKDQLPVNVEGRVLVPMSSVFEQLGFEVKWDDDNKAVLMRRNGVIYFVPVGRNQFIIREEGKEDRMSGKYDVPAQNIKGRVMLPISAFAEVGGFTITWDDNIKTVIITTGAPIAEPETTHGTPSQYGTLTYEQIEASGLFEFDMSDGDVRYYDLTREISREYAIGVVKSLRFFKEDGKYYVEGTLPELDPILVAGEFENVFDLILSFPKPNGGLSSYGAQNESKYRPSPDYGGKNHIIPSAGYFKVELPALMSDGMGINTDIPIERMAIGVRYGLHGERFNPYSFEGLFEADGTPMMSYPDTDRTRVSFGIQSDEPEKFNPGDLQLKVEW